MQASRWKSISGFDGSEKTFIERVRTPDAKFRMLLTTLGFAMPIAFGLFMIPVALLPLLTEAFLGSHSAITQGLHTASSYALKFFTVVFVVVFVGMKVLQVYVAAKLRKQKREQSQEG